MAGVSPNVVVAADDLNLLDEIVRHLEELPHWRLSASARTVDQLVNAVAAGRPDAVLISASMVRDLAEREQSLGNVRIVVFGREEDSASLRASLRLEARGFVLWPQERKDLRSLVEKGLALATQSHRVARGSLTSFWAPKGGSGASVLAAHVASVLASFGIGTLLVDLDLDHGDQSAILGAEREPKTILDLLRVIEEATPSVVDSIAWAHPAGFRAVLSPGAPGEAALVKAAELRKALVILKDSAEQVVADLPSGFGEAVFAAAEESSRIVLVVTPDVLSLRRSKTAVKALDSAGIEPSRVEIVMNQTGAREVTPRDVEAVLSRPVVAAVHADTGLLRAPDRGEIAGSGRRLLEPVARRISGLPQVAPTRLRVLLRR